MTDHEDDWTAHRIGCTCGPCQGIVTQGDVWAESAAVIKALRKEHAKDMDVIRDQLSYLQKTHTVALMAADIYAHTQIVYESAVIRAQEIYREVQKTLEIG